jgi:hypothetical protein
VEECQIQEQWRALDPELRRVLVAAVEILDHVVIPDRLAARIPLGWTSTMFVWFGEDQPVVPGHARRVPYLSPLVRAWIQSRAAYTEDLLHVTA